MRRTTEALYQLPIFVRMKNLNKVNLFFPNISIQEGTLNKQTQVLPKYNKIFLETDHKVEYDG